MLEGKELEHCAGTVASWVFSLVVFVMGNARRGSCSRGRERKEDFRFGLDFAGGAKLGRAELISWAGGAGKIFVLGRDICAGNLNCCFND